LPSSSRKKSQRQVPNGDKVVPATSSDDSSSESENDESGRTSIESRSKHVLKPPKFDGKTSFETFWAQLQNCATNHQWTRAQKLVFLKNSLEKDAANVLWDYGTEVTDSFSGLTKTLRMRFGGASFADKHIIELKNRRRTKGETLKALHSDVRRLAALAFPDMDQKNREVVSCDYFIDALDDPDFGLKIREKQPADLDSALRIA